MEDVETLSSSQEDRLLRNTLFTFFVGGACSPLGSFLPFLRESYGFSYDFSGILLSIQSMGILVSLLVVGFLPAYLGRRKCVLVTSAWMGVAYLIFAGGLGAPALLALAAAMIGIARGSNVNFSNTMVSTLPGEKATRGFNLLHGSFAMGCLISPLLLVLCSNRWPNGGWRITAGVLCAMCVVQQVVYATTPLPLEGSEKGVRGVKALDHSFLRVKAFWLGTVILFFYISTEYAINGWLVTYFQDIGVLNADQAQMMNSLLWLVIFAGRMTGAAITGKVSRNRLLLVDGFGLFAFFLVMFSSRSPLPVILSLMGTGFFMSTIYPTALALGSDAIRGNDLGCSAMIFMATTGGVIAPALIGFVAEQAGIQAGMGLIVGCTTLLLVSILVSVISVKRSVQNK